MKLLSVILSILGMLSSINAYAQSSQVWTMQMGSETKKIKLIRIKGEVLGTESCSKPCKALEVLNKKIQPKAVDSKSPLVGNPASKFCASVDGKVRILRDEKGNEYDFCEFADKSMFDTWQAMKALNN